MLKKIWSGLKYYLFLGIGIALLYIVFRDVDFAWMWNEIRNADFRWLGLSFLCGLMAMVSRAIRWRILLEPLGYQPGLLNCFNGVGLGYFANIAIPRMGEIVRCTVLSQTNHIPVNQLIGTVLLERVIDLLILLSLILVVVVTQLERFGRFFLDEIMGERFKNFSSPDAQAIWLYLAVFLLLAGGVAFAWWFFRRFRHIPLVQKLVAFLRGISDGFIALFKLKRKGAFLFHTLFIWFNYFVMTWVCFYAYDPTAALGALDGLFMMVVGGLGMTAPVSGGFGAFHFLVEKALLIYHIEPSVNELTGEQMRPGLVFATIVHTTQFILTLCVGIFSLVTFALLKRRQHAKTSA